MRSKPTAFRSPSGGPTVHVSLQNDRPVRLQFELRGRRLDYTASRGNRQQNRDGGGSLVQNCRRAYPKTVQETFGQPFRRGRRPAPAQFWDRF